MDIKKPRETAIDFPGSGVVGLGDHQFIKKLTLARNAARRTLENTQL